jgi:hypothetical protein
MVNEFQAVNTPRACCRDHDHEPLKQRYRDTRAYGRVKELAARADGLYGRVKFNATGRQIVADEMFHGHSVNWGMKKIGGKWHPFRLKSVGWTNEPQIPVAPVTAANEPQYYGSTNIKLAGLTKIELITTTARTRRNSPR